MADTTVSDQQLQDDFDAYVAGSPTDQPTSTGSDWGGIFSQLPSVLTGAAGIVTALGKPKTVAAAASAQTATASASTVKYIIFGGIGLVVIVGLFLFSRRGK